MTLLRDTETYRDGATGDMYYRNSTGLLVPVSGTQTTGYIPTKQGDGTIAWAASAAPSGAWTTIIKPTDQTRSSTTTLADDSALTFACLSGKVYVFRLFVHFSIANGAMDYKYGINFTGTTSAAHVFVSHSDPGAGAGTTFRFEFLSSSLAGAASSPLGSGASDGTVLLDGTFTTTSSGTFSYRWAQNTSDAANATTRAGSYLEYASV